MPLNPEHSVRAELVAPARVRDLFGQRGKTETVHLEVPRKFGGTLRSRRRYLTHREPMVKGLVYNIHR